MPQAFLMEPNLPGARPMAAGKIGGYHHGEMQKTEPVQ
jgi:hypothetical protein